MTQAIAITPRAIGRMGARVCGFTIVEQIADGNGAAVYRASDDKRDVAVKIYERKTDASRNVIAARALVESAAQGLVQHPAVARLVDATLLPDGAYCLVSEWVHGVLLPIVIAEAPSWERTRRIVESINAGLGAIHAAGVIHRDLSPGNIIAPRAQVPAAVIVDFSNALVLDGVRSAPGPGCHGASAYVSPEQLAGLPLDGRADLYALGVVIYELLTGAVPDEAMTSPRKRAPDREIPAVGEELCMWLLAKDRDARVPSSRVLAVTLGALASTTGGQP